MIRITSVSIQNFLSYGAVPTVINLDTKGTTLIVGEDLDNTASGTGANGVGKAQPLHCKIKTPNGWIRMGDIKIGDVVTTPSGTNTTVTGVFPQGEIDTYKVIFADGRSTEACENHLWQVNSHRWKKDNKSNASKTINTLDLKHYVDEANIKNKAWYNITIPTITPAELEYASVPIDPYLLGAFLGDGTICHRNIRFSSMDNTIISNVSEILKEWYGQELVHQKNADLYVRNIKSCAGRNPIADALDKLHLLGTHSNDKFIPNQYLDDINTHQKLELLQGLLDTDGTVGKNGSVSYCSVSKQLAKDVQYLIRSIGGKAKISEKVSYYTNKDDTKQEGQLAYNVLIQYNNPKELFRLDRKKERLSDKPQYANAGLRVVAVKKIHKQESQCIMVDDPEHLYITDDFIVTHNTVWLNALIYGLYGKPISNIKADNLVNNINNTHLEVIVEFIKDDKIFTVKRVRKEKGAGNYAKVFCRGIEERLDQSKHDVTPDSIKNIDVFVERALGIPFELFVRIVAFPATHTPFLDLPVRHASQANQSDIMEELFRLNRLSEKGDLLKLEIKDTKQSLDIKQRHNEQLETEHERHSTQVDSAINRVVDWDNEHGIKIAAAKKALKEFDDIDLDEQLDLFNTYSKLYDASYDYNNKIKDLDGTIKETTVRLDAAKHELESLDATNAHAMENFNQWKLDNAKAIEKHEDDLKGLVPRGTLKKQLELHDTISELNDDRSILIAETKKIDNDITLLIKVISDNESELSHLLDAKCPYCLQKYENTETKIASCKAEVDDANEKLKVKNNAKVAYDEAFVLLDKEIADTRNQITHHPEEIQAEETLRTNLLAAIENFENTTNPYNDQVEAIDETRSYEIQKKIEQYEKDIKRDNKKIKKLDDNLQGVIVNMSNAEKDIMFDSVDLVYEAKAKFELAQSNLETLKNTVNPHTEALEELRAVVLEKIDMDGVNKLDKLLTHQQYLQKLLTKKDSFIRKNLLSKNLIFLNQRLKGYLGELGLPHRVEFTQEMTAKISQFGRELDFGNLSSGQKARVNLALSFSFRDVLQRSLDSVNVCMLDEVLDVGLDSVGIQNAAKMLKRKAREDELSLFIISHRDEISGIFDKKLVVQMSKGFSNIRLE